MLKNNAENEKRLIGCYLQGSRPHQDITDSVFSTAALKIVYKTIIELKAQGVSVDLPILANELEKQGKLDQCGGYAAIAELTTGAYQSNVSYFESQVLSAFRRRKLWEEATLIREGLEKGESPERLQETFQNHITQVLKYQDKDNTGISFKDLLEKQFPPDNWLIENLITTGLTVLTGASKIGKSWTALQLITALDQGGFFLGKLKAERCDCLYLALEDTPKRIQKRLKKQGIAAFNGSRLEVKRRTVGDLRLFLKNNPQYKVIVIDTLQKMLGMNDLNDYAQTVDGLSALKAIADDLDLAIIVIHHNRKGGNEDGDHMESALGSTGINATADCTLTMRRKRGVNEATLSVTGRDVEDTSYTLEWDKDVCSWTVTGQGELTSSLSEAQQQIISLLESEERNWTKTEIVDAIGKSKSATGNLLAKMKDDNLIESPYYGQYRAKERNTETPSLRENVFVFPDKANNIDSTSGQEPAIW